MARVKGQQYPAHRRTAKAPVKRKQEEEEEEEVEEVVEEKQQPVVPKRRAGGRRRRVAVLEFEKEEEKEGGRAAMSTGGLRTPETKKNETTTPPPDAPVKVRVKFPQREREQLQKRERDEEERQASPSEDLPKKRVWIPPPVQLVEVEESPPPTGLDFVKHRNLIKCCERVGSPKRRGWQYGRIMQAAYDLLLVLWCKKQVGHNRELEFSCPEDIDECWHEFILNTDEYAQFAEAFGFFPRHTTFTSDDSDEAKMRRIQALMAFGKSRGIKFNSEFWPSAAAPVVPADDLGLFDIYVKTLTGKAITVKVSEMTTVFRLKEKLEQLEGFPVDAQRLIFAGHHMDETKLLKEYGVSFFSTIHLVMRIGGGIRRGEDFQVFVKTTTGKTFTIRVMANTTVAEMKQKILDKEGIPVDQQRLIYRGTEMNDNHVVEKYNITFDAMIHLVIKLRGC